MALLQNFKLLGSKRLNASGACRAPPAAFSRSNNKSVAVVDAGYSCLPRSLLIGTRRVLSIGSDHCRPTGARQPRERS